MPEMGKGSPEHKPPNRQKKKKELQMEFPEFRSKTPPGSPDFYLILFCFWIFFCFF